MYLDYTRIGYDLEIEMTHILKRKDFARWQAGEKLPDDEKKALQFAGKVFLELSGDALAKALQSGVLLEVHCEQDH